MTTKEHFSVPRKLFIFLIILVSLGLIIFSISEIVEIFKEVTKAPPEIVYDSGTVRMLGCGIALGALMSHVLLNTTKIFDSRPRLDKSFIVVTMVGVVLALFLPIIIHLPLEDYLVEKGYKICEPKSVFYKGGVTTVYTTDIPTCLDGLGLDYIVVDSEGNEVL